MYKKALELLTMFLLSLTVLGFVIPVTYSMPAVLPREETLYVAEAGKVADPTNLNLYAVWAFGWGLHQVCLENMFYINLQTGEYIPWTAEGYEYNKDYTSITIHLRQGVKWSDGEPFTADDVVFTYTMLIDNAPKLAWSSMVKDFVQEAVKVDDYTVTLVLTGPNPRIHLKREVFPVARVWSGIHIVPKHIWEGKDPLAFKFNPPVGTGPYKLVSSSETAYIWERRDDWWATDVFGVRPAPKYVVWAYHGKEETVAMKLTANEEADAVTIGIMGLSTVKTVMDRNPYVRAWYRSLPYAWLDPCPRAVFLQDAKYPWNITEVRRAISYYINRDEVVSLAFENTTEPSWGPFPYYSLFAPGGRYYDAIDDLIEEYEPTAYNPTKAEEILTDLGFSKTGGKWYTPKGDQLTMTLLTDGYDAEKMKVHAVLYDQLTTAGITVTRSILTGPSHEDALLKGEWDITSHCLCPGDTDPYDNLELMHSKYWVPLGDRAPWYEGNSFRYKNPTYDGILDDLAAEPPGTAEELVYFRDAMEIFFQDVPIIPFYQAPALVPFTTYYWTGWPTAEDPWNMPVWWWSTFNLVINGYKSPTTGEWVGGLRPRTLEYATAYFTKDTPKFRAIDLIWYGPFETGGAARIPADDAEFWINKGYASYTSPLPTIPTIPTEIIEGIARDVSVVKGDVSALKEDMTSLSDKTGALAGQMGTLTTVASIEGIAIIVLAVALIVVRRKPT